METEEGVEVLKAFEGRGEDSPNSKKRTVQREEQRVSEGDSPTRGASSPSDTPARGGPSSSLMKAFANTARIS